MLHLQKNRKVVPKRRKSIRSVGEKKNTTSVKKRLLVPMKYQVEKKNIRNSQTNKKAKTKHQSER